MGSYFSHAQILLEIVYLFQIYSIFIVGHDQNIYQTLKPHPAIYLVQEASLAIGRILD